MSTFSALGWVHHNPREDKLNLILKTAWKSGDSAISLRDPVMVPIDTGDKASECEFFRNWSLGFFETRNNRAAFQPNL